MAINLTVYPHKHKWHTWFATYNVTNDQLHRTKFEKVYKCWKCGSQSKDKTPIYMGIKDWVQTWLRQMTYYLV